MSAVGINDLDGGGGACGLHPCALMRKWAAVVSLSSSVILAGCGGSSPSEPGDGSNSRVLEGRTVSAIDGVVAPGVALAVGTKNVTADSNGYFRLDVGGPSTFNLRARGNNIVERETTLSGPSAEPARVSLIPSTFDLDSFNQMFRPNGGLQRWTTRPGLVVFASVMSYTGGNREEYAATSEQLTEEEVTLLINHLTEGLSILTSGTFTSFASVEVERPASGARASVNRPGKIVMGRYNGIVSFANTIGYGQWALVVGWIGRRRGDVPRSRFRQERQPATPAADPRARSRARFDARHRAHVDHESVPGSRRQRLRSCRHVDRVSAATGKSRARYGPVRCANYPLHGSRNGVADDLLSVSGTPALKGGPTAH